MLSKKGLRSRANSDSCLRGGRRFGDDGAAGPRSAAAHLRVYLDEMIPADHLLRRIHTSQSALMTQTNAKFKRLLA
jgi:hypothetical protein